MRPFVNPSVRVAAPGDAPKHHVQTRTMLQLNHGAMLHLNHGGGRAPAVYCDDVERIARRQGATREEEHFLFFCFCFSFFSPFFFTHTHTHMDARAAFPVRLGVIPDGGLRSTVAPCLA